MCSYKELKDKESEIFEKIRSLGDGEDKNKHQFLIDIPNIENLKINSLVLVLGLNSSYLGERPPSSFFHIPNKHANLNKSVSEQVQKHTYSKYFGMFIDSFQTMNPSYYPIWYNEKILCSIFEKNTKYLNDNLREPM